MADDFDENAVPAHRDESKIATPASMPMSEMQMRLAHDNPRDEKRVFSGALAELEVNPDFADEAYYSIPYKDKKGGDKIIMVEGLSIKAAMSLARRWGNCANGARVSDERDERVICQGMFFDYETNVLTLRDISVSKWIKKRDGGTYRLDSNRLNMAILSGESKAVRNAILATLPAYLKESYFSLARNLVINPPAKEGKKAKTVEERIEDGKAFFVTKLGATKIEIDNVVASWIVDEDGRVTFDEILSRLIGLKNAIKDGQISVDAAMGRQEKAAIGMPQERAPIPTPTQDAVGIQSGAVKETVS